MFASIARSAALIKATCDEQKTKAKLMATTIAIRSHCQRRDVLRGTGDLVAIAIVIHSHPRAG